MKPSRLRPCSRMTAVGAVSADRGVHRGGRPRRVHRDVGQPARVQHRERVLGVPRQPGGVPELHRDRGPGQAGGQPGEIRERPIPVLHPRRHLEEHVAELARVGQRLQPLAERGEGPRARVLAEDVVLELAPLVGPGGGGQQGGERRRQPARVQVMPGEQRVGLHAEEEAGRRALRPEHRVLGGQRRVERGVDLDGVEEAAVPPEPLLRPHALDRVERARPPPCSCPATRRARRGTPS